MKFNCPKCDKTLEVDDASAGLHTECPLCTEPLVIPTAHPIRLANPSIKTPSIPDSGILGFVSNISGAMKISAVLHFTPGNLKITYVATGFLGLGKEKVEILDPTPYVLTVDILDIGTGEMRSLDAAKGTLEGTTYGAYSLTCPSELQKNICLGIVQCLSNAQLQSWQFRKVSAFFYELSDSYRWRESTGGYVSASTYAANRNKPITHELWSETFF